MDKPEQKRTNSQNRSIHKMFAEIAREALERGIERKTVLNSLEGYSCPLDEAFIKEVWRAIMFTQIGKISTTEMTTAEIDRVYETFNRFWGESFGIHVPFPSIEAMYAHEWYDDNK